MSNVDRSNAGRRVELISTTDPYTKLKPGDKGTYEMALRDPWGDQHCIKWDNGSNLMLVSGSGDSFKFID